jgi:oxygen-independent coproporphyrinogen III oxidase
MIGLYIHIPFCLSKCPYCDFVSFETADAQKYIAALNVEIEDYGQAGQQKVDTIFFGGGTPTSIEPIYIESVLNAIHTYFSVAQTAEITIEANPGTVSLNHLKAYKKMGINRISFGLQSANDHELETLGRVHRFNDFEVSFSDARKAGFENINVDLMFGLPNQSITSFKTTLEIVINVKPEHISCYSLKIEKKTPYYKDYYGSPALPSEDDERDMYHLASNSLKDQGYIHYETSNFAKKGYHCKHNLKYWTQIPYFGFGVSAHSLFFTQAGKHVRYSNTSDYDLYISQLKNNEMPVLETQTLSEKDMMDEYIMLNLRLNTGIVFDDYNKAFDADFENDFKTKIDALLKNKMITTDANGIYPTLKGFDLQNTMIAMFL